MIQCLVHFLALLAFKFYLLVVRSKKVMNSSRSHRRKISPKCSFSHLSFFIYKMGIIIHNSECCCDCNPIEPMTHAAQIKSSIVAQEHTPLKIER